MLDVQKIRKDFPLLQKSMRGKPFVYLDNGATSLKPQSVIDAITGFYTDLGANIHRGAYEFSEEATIAYDKVRERIKKFFSVPEDGEIIFTRGTTESTNLIAQSWAMKFIKEGDEIVTTELEHHSNLVPWQEVAVRKGAILRFIPANHETGVLDTSSLDYIITPRTKFVAITGMSNVTGYLPPIKKIIEAAHSKNAKVLIDGAQLGSHHTVNLSELDPDFFVFSGHKMLGPTGIGGFYAKKDTLDKMDPYHYGGDMILKVWKDRSTYADVPFKFEAGTPNIAGVLGMDAALDYLEKLGMDAIAQHEKELFEYALEKALADPDLSVYGPLDSNLQGGILSFNIRDIHPHDVGTFLDRQGVAVRTGFHCCQPFMQILRIPGTVRASFYIYNDYKDIDALFASLQGIKDVFL